MRFLLAILGAVLALGYGGALHPALDSLALLRLPLAALVLGLALLPWAPGRWRMSFAALALLSLGAWFTPLLSRNTDANQLTLYQKNLWYANPEVEALAEHILARDADVVTLQEVSTRNRRILSLLSERYPFQHVCQFSGWAGVAVLSKLPKTDAAPFCSTGRAFAALQVDGRAGPLWVVSTHLPWPYPYAQIPRISTNRDQLEALSGPVVMAGDFNTVSWSRAVRSVAQSSKTKVVGPQRATLQLDIGKALTQRLGARGERDEAAGVLGSVTKLGLRIDLVLAQSGDVTREGLWGSDHQSLFAKLNYK